MNVRYIWIETLIFVAAWSIIVIGIIEWGMDLIEMNRIAILIVSAVVVGAAMLIGGFIYGLMVVGLE
jgi:hypothetical protein